MRVIENVLEFQSDVPTIVLLGKFDGVHQGHQKLIAKASALAREKMCQVAVLVMNFPFREDSLLTTREERNHLLEKFGVDIVVECDFNSIRDVSAEDFLKEIILQRLKGQTLVAGPDCAFGKNRQGDAAFAREYLLNYHCDTEIVPKVQLENGEVISSSLIREYIKTGKIQEANEMLGYHFFYEGFVEEGRKLGRQMAFPTVNIGISPEKVKAQYGVYQSLVHLMSEPNTYIGVSNVGIKPTVEVQKPLVETHLLYYDNNLYGQMLRVELQMFLREEKKFASVEELRVQIKRDVARVEMSLK